jgi:TRAP-type C4-dicarboxylate transport system substrate-binding protein
MEVLLMKRFAKHLTTGVALLVAAAMMLALVGTASAAPIKIRFSHVVSPNTPKGQAADMFAKLANERLKGKVEVQVFPNSQLYTDKKVLDALSTGSVEMAAPSTAKFTSWVPQLQLFDLPFLFKNSDVLYQTIDGKVGKKLYKMLGKKNMLGLAMWDNGFKQIGNNQVQDHVLQGAGSPVQGSWRQSAGYALFRSLLGPGAGRHRRPGKYLVQYVLQEVL